MRTLFGIAMLCAAPCFAGSYFPIEANSCGTMANNFTNVARQRDAGTPMEKTMDMNREAIKACLEAHPDFCAIKDALGEVWVMRRIQEIYASPSSPSDIGDDFYEFCTARANKAS